MNGKCPICTFSPETGCVCTEIIIFATEIRKPWLYDPNGSPNKRGRSLNNYYEFSMAAPVFYCCMVKVLEWERLRERLRKNIYEKHLIIREFPNTFASSKPRTKGR